MDIAYLNTDLELRSSQDLTSLVDQLGHGGMHTLHCEALEDGQWFACLEVNDDDVHEVPQSTIAAILDAIDRLTGDSLNAWENCSSRELNIGIDSGTSPRAAEYTLSAGTVQRVADAGLKLGITVYAAPEAADAPQQDTGNNPG